MTGVLDQLNETIADYERASLADPLKADVSPLRESLDLVREGLARTDMAPEVVHAAFAIYLHLNDKESRLELVQEYLARPLPMEEEAWARWNFVDTLAVLRRYEETVEAQREFLDWARKRLPHDLLMWVMHDGSQSGSWFMTGRMDEWLEIFRDIMAGVEPRPENRFWRFHYLRAAAANLGMLARAEEALEITDRILRLSQEDETWGESFRAKIESYVLKMWIHREAGDTERLLEVADQARAIVDEYAASLPDSIADPDRLVRSRPPEGMLAYHGRWDTKAHTDPIEPAFVLRMAYLSMGYVLYRARQYSPAIPLFEKAMAYKNPQPHCYLWQAASVWATTKDRARVVALLRRAASVFAQQKDFLRSAPEFQDVADDPEFQEAVSLVT